MYRNVQKAAEQGEEESLANSEGLALDKLMLPILKLSYENFGAAFAPSFA